MSGIPRDEAVASRDADSGHSRRWAIWHHQFDLVRAADGVRYLRRWWIVKTPWGGIALHRMDGPDARETLHDHPFPFVSIVLRGGYLERRLDPKTMLVQEARDVGRVNVVRRHDAHTIRQLLRVPTWTLLLVGRHRRTWGFWEPLMPLTDWEPDGLGGTRPSGWIAAADGEWRWTKHDAFDSGHYVP